MGIPLESAQGTLAQQKADSVFSSTTQQQLGKNNRSRPTAKSNPKQSGRLATDAIGFYLSSIGRVPLLTAAEEIEEAMKGEGDDLDKWNNWVEAANKEAEKVPEKNPTTFIHTGDGQNNVTVQEALELPKEEAVDKEIELPDTQNRIFYTKELEHSDAPKKKGSSYIVKEQGTQIRKKTNPGE